MRLKSDRFVRAGKTLRERLKLVQGREGQIGKTAGSRDGPWEALELGFPCQPFLLARVPRESVGFPSPCPCRILFWDRVCYRREHVCKRLPPRATRDLGSAGRVPPRLPGSAQSLLGGVLPLPRSAACAARAGRSSSLPGVKADSALLLRSRRGSSLLSSLLKLQMFPDFGIRDRFVRRWPFGPGLLCQWLRLQGGGAVHGAGRTSRPADLRWPQWPFPQRVSRAPAFQVGRPELPAPEQNQLLRKETPAAFKYGPRPSLSSPQCSVYLGVICF